YVWAILAGSGVGIVASTQSRLFSSAWFALHDTRTPFRFAAVRVGLAVAMGSFASLVLPGLLGIEPRWGAAGITVAGGLAAIVEFALLRRGLDRRIGRLRLPPGYALRLWATALAGAGAAWAVLRLIEGRIGPVLTAVFVLLPYGVIYLGGTLLLGIPFARELGSRLGVRR
ncbi:MAG TPA: lipid II flippase MurJ, partial [Gemmatimonadales bacterium]|nr:lipid II flippase MurJ [Gemmatimonadales bacterium]